MFSTNLEMLKVVTFSDIITFNSHNNSLPFSPFREGNSNPLQCSCLETPHGVIFLPGDAPASVHLNSNSLYLVLLLSELVQMT